MRKFSLALVALIAPYISCWKPIPSHPSAFSVSQSYPPIGGESTIARKSSNELLNSDTVDIYVDSFHKDDYIHSHQDVSVLKHLKDGRSSQSLRFESNIFNGIFHDVSKAFSSLHKDCNSDIKLKRNRKILESLCLSQKPSVSSVYFCLWQFFSLRTLFSFSFCHRLCTLSSHPFMTLLRSYFSSASPLKLLRCLIHFSFAQILYFFILSWL